jgi:hypothetical protein
MYDPRKPSAWIDPRDVDWTQSLNPLANPGWNPQNNPYVYRALQYDPFMLALRSAKGVEPRIYVGPDVINQSIPAGSTQDYEVPIEPNFWLYGVAASGTGEDFLFNVTDSVTGATLFSQPMPLSRMPSRLATSGRGPQLFLSTPQLYLPPSYPIIRVINTTAFANVCRVTLFGCIEYDV